MKSTPSPYSIRIDKLKPDLERIAFDRKMKLPELIKAILRTYIRKVEQREKQKQVA